MNSRPNRDHKRPRKSQRRRGAPGSAPGTIQVDPNAPKTVIRVIAFDGSQLVEEELNSSAQLSRYLSKWPTIWIDVIGLGSAETIHGIGELLGLHPLAMEDVVNVHQRAKVDSFRDYLFVVARMMDGVDTHTTEQISFFLKNGVLLSFQERPGDCWEPVRNRLRQSRGRIRSLGADYLLYALLDAIVDSYFPVTDLISDQVDSLDEEITVKTQPKQIHEIHRLRSQLLYVRRALRPHREMVNELVRDDYTLITSESRIFFRDCYDHVIQLLDIVDTYREFTADLRDCYLSSVSNHMNEIMKVLTIMSSIFIPLSFIAGVYGMNFNRDVSAMNMPELDWYYGYPFSLSLMLATAIGLIFFFRRPTLDLVTAAGVALRSWIIR